MDARNQAADAGGERCGCTGGNACPPVSLCKLKPGQVAVVAEARLAAKDASLLSAMGLCEEATIRVCRVGEPCIVSVVGRGGKVAAGALSGAGGGNRIGLTLPLAERIFVRAVEP